MAKTRWLSLAAALAWVLASAAPAAAEDAFPPWKGREDQIVRALLEGEVVDLQPVGHGVTQPWRAELEIDGERLFAVWKPIDSSASRHIKESFKAEVAAYRLSRLLGMDRVPPTVARRIDRKLGSLQYWVEGCQLFEEVKDQLPASIQWTREMARMRFFDLVVDNPDRNSGNFLVDDRWRIVMIDHSRALAFDAYSQSKRRRPPVLFDRALVEHLGALDLAALESELDGLLPRYLMKAILKKGNRLLRHVEKTVAERGEGVFFE